MVLSVLCAVFCCLIGGIVAAIYSSKSNTAYNTASFTTDPTLRDQFYMQSESYNNTAKTWIIVSLVAGAIEIVASVIAGIAGAFSQLLYS